MAAVTVSIVHVLKGGDVNAPRSLDGRHVEQITAYLFHEGGHQDPERLASNTEGSFQGAVVVGMGFTFDDTDNTGVATALEDMHRLLQQDSAHSEVILPYIGGEEVNTNPTHSHHRYVINFGERSEEECRERWPALMAIVEEKVRPRRQAALAKSYSNDKKRRADLWWQFARPAEGLYNAINNLERILAINCGATPHASFAFLPAKMVYAHSLAVFPYSSFAAFCALQARPHEVWARFFGSSLEDRLRYTPSDCFETFPFPEGWNTSAKLEAAGKEYYEFRAALMVANDEGLTTTYNRFHNPEERDTEIVRLRDLHAQMDRLVLDAYGWADIPTDCDFFLDYEIDKEEWGRKKKPWRYRWPDEVRDEVLARLLALNGERAAAEAQARETEARLFE